MGDKKCTTLEMNSNTVDVIEDIRAKLKGDYPVTKTALAIGSTAEYVASGAFDYIIGGVRYSMAAEAAGTEPGDDVIPVDTYGAVALDIDSSGIITIAEAADNSTGYASAALALAGIPDVSSAKARMGTVSVIRETAGAFTFGTTALDDGDTTVVYTDGETNLEAISTADISI